MPNLQPRISAFQEIRDIPYRIALTPEEQDYSCATKPKMLAEKLSALGLESRRILCEFRWHSLGIPAEVLRYAKSHTDTHEYLEVLIPESGEWVTVDPSWDARLKNAGLTISDWDGEHATAIGVTPIKTYSVDESACLIAAEESGDPDVRKKYLADNKEFFSALNAWLESKRKK